MSLSTNTTFRVYLEKLGGSNPSEFIGNSGEIFLDPSVPTLKLSDGSTPGGVDIGGGGGIGGGIGTDGSVNTTGIITASSFSGTTATFSGNISVGGTLTYDDVTNVDSIGLITARTGIEVLSGIVTTPKLHVDSVGSGITFSEDLVVQGNARVTGILSIGTSSIVLDSNAKIIRGVEQIRIESPEQNAKPIIIKQSTEKIIFVKTEEVDGEEVETDQEVSVGIGSTANINTTGIITAASFVGDGSGLTNLPASDVTSVNTLTGAVSLGVEDLDDFLLQATPPVSSYNAAKQSDGDFSGSGSTTGGFALELSGGNYTTIYINKNNPTSGTSLASQGFTAGTSLDLWVSADGANFTQHTATNSFNQGSNNAQFSGLSPDLTAYSSAGALYFSLTSVAGTPIPLADEDILQYESATSKFRPVQLAVSSVNTLTGAVSLGIEDLDDVQYNVTTTATVYEFTYAGTSGFPATGEFKVILDGSSNTDTLRINPTDANGLSVPSFTQGNTIWISADQTNYSTITAGSGTGLTSGHYLVGLSNADEAVYDSLGIAIGETLYLSNTDPNPQTVNPSNGEILQYEATTSKFRPVQLGVDDLSDVDTSTVAPTDGQALVWDNANSQWEPGTVSGGGGGSSFFVQNATGIHTLSNVGIGTTNATETLTVDGTIGMPLGNVLIGGYNVGSSLQPDVGNYAGTSNVFIGHGQNAGEYAAGQYTTTGSGNVFVGPGAGQENTTGFNNVYIGAYAGQYATTASDNICLGLLAGFSIDGTGATDGRTNNIFMGRRSGVTNTTGTDNTFLGFNSGYSNTTGTYNNFIGHDAGRSNTIGSHNNFFGNDAGRSNTTGDNNVFIGQDAGLLNTTGYNNVFIGQDAGRSHSTGQYNCSIGKDAGRSLTDGFDNTFIGKEAGKDTTEGFYNTFIGSNAGQYNTEAYGNIFIGQFTGQYTTGLNSYQNTMIGGYCGQYNTGGYYNVFLGAFSGSNNTTGYYNTFLGVHAGQTNTTGDHNICIGDRTLSSTTASYKIILGQGFTDADRFDSPDTTSDYQFAVGIRTDSNQSQYWLVGDENFNIGINSTAPTAKLDVLGDVRVGNSNSQGIILTSPNGTQYRLVVANDGTLSTSAV